jgi:hypothetical protein
MMGMSSVMHRHSWFWSCRSAWAKITHICFLLDRFIDRTSTGFDATGTLTVEGLNNPVSYIYTVAEHNTNERTIQGFSTGAKGKMYTCEKCPYVTYEKFEQYYGQFDYADKWVTAAFDGGSTSFANGNADFGAYSEVGRSGKFWHWLLGVVSLPVACMIHGARNLVLTSSSSFLLSILQRQSRRVLPT